MNIVRNYCCVCGNKVRQTSFKSWWCDKCDQDYYANPKLCVELALFNQAGQLAIGTRANEPFKGKLSLPGGFVDLGETAEEALLREIKEEIGITQQDIDAPVYVTSYKSEYPWGKETYSQVVLVFKARLVSDAVLHAQDDVAAVAFMDSPSVPVDKLALPKIYPRLFEQLKSGV